MTNIKKIMITLLMILTVVGMTYPMEVNAARSYTITFRAGAHGTFVETGTNKIEIKVAAGEKFPDIPDMIVEDGYYASEWNKDLPAVNSTVEGSMTFVAKYRVLTDGKEYTIKYVDQNDVAIQTAKIMMAPKGTVVHERAKTIEGYELIGNADLSIAVADSDNVIKFVYRNLASNVEYVETIVQVPASEAPDNQAASNEVVVEEEEPSGDVENPEPGPQNPTEDVDDPETPLADGVADNTYLYLVGGVVIGLVILAAILLFLKKKKELSGEAN